MEMKKILQSSFFYKASLNLDFAEKNEMQPCSFNHISHATHGVTHIR